MKLTREYLKDLLDNSLVKYGLKAPGFPVSLAKELEVFINNLPDEYFEQEWPQEGDEVHLIHNEGSIICVKYNASYLPELKQGRIKRTREEAEFKRDLEALYAEMDQWGEKHSDPIDWDDHRQYKHYLYYVPYDKNVFFNFDIGMKTPGIPYVTANCKDEFLSLFGPRLEEIMKR